MPVVFRRLFPSPPAVGRRTLRSAAVRLIAAATLALGSSTCDFLEHPDEVQNSTNNAFIEVQIFASRDDRQPVEGVIMYVESDPDSERPFNGPDQTFVSDANGFVRAAVFPGLDPEGAPEGGPTTPLDGLPFLFYGDACVHFILDGTISTFSCGITMGAGKVIKLGSVFATDFVPAPGGGVGGGGG
jgi:hypothetical protein